MEQQQSQTKASPERSVPRGFERCQARNRDRSQCRLHAQDPATGLCRRHAACAHKAAVTIDDSSDISLELLDSQRGALDSTHAINTILTNIVIMLAQGRISPRRASVITFALSLMLRSVVVMDRVAANTPPQIIFDAPGSAPSENKPATGPQDNSDANPQAYPQTSHEALENYARLRT